LLRAGRPPSAAATALPGARRLGLAGMGAGLERRHHPDGLQSRYAVRTRIAKNATGSQVVTKSLTPENDAATIWWRHRQYDQDPLADRPASDHRLEPGVVAVAAAELARGLTVGEDDVGGEVVRAANQRRPD